MLYLIELGNGDEMPLISIIIVLAFYILLHLRLRTQPQQCILNMKTASSKYCQLREKICGNVWDEMHKNKECKRLQLLEMKIGFL